MEILVAILAVVVTIGLGVFVQAGLLMLASSLAADKPVGFGPAVAVVIGATLANFVVQGVLALSGAASLLFSGPMSLLVWAVTLSAVTEMRISQAVFTAIGMTVIQVALFFGFVAVVGALALGGGMVSP